MFNLVDEFVYFKYKFWGREDVLSMKKMIKNKMKWEPKHCYIVGLICQVRYTKQPFPTSHKMYGRPKEKTKV